MRISFSCKLKPESGKQNFAIRLARSFRKMGIRVTDKNPDVNLVFVKKFRKKCKNILRLDGVWMNTRMNYSKKNRILSNYMKKADGIIYQNEFCKKSYDHFCIKPPCPYDVISNGANPKAFLSDTPKKYFLTLCRWRPHKRLREIVQGFLLSGLAEKYKLIICGKPDYFISHSSINYKGRVSIKRIENLISDCSGTIHLAYIDWCPNSVVESLVAGKAVLHTTSGGTSSLVKDNGVCVNDKEWNFKPLDLYSPPNLDSNEVAEGYNKLLTVSKFERSDLYINTIAKQYMQFIEKILLKY